MASDEPNQSNHEQPKICIERYCPAVVNSKYARCDHHRMKAAEYQKTFRRRLKERGKCISCSGENEDRKYNYCSACRCKRRERWKFGAAYKPHGDEISSPKPKETKQQDLQAVDSQNHLGEAPELGVGPSEQQSFAQVDCQQHPDEDIAAAHILLQMSISRYINL